MLRQPHPARSTRALAAAIPLLLPATPSAAFTPYRTWIGASGGSWAVAANWSPNGIPGSSESLTITGTTSNYTVNYNGTYTTLGPANVILDASSSTNSLTFNHSVTNNLYSSSVVVGATTGHVTYAQTAGTNTIGGNLNIGYSAGSAGTYTLSGTGQVSAFEEGVGTYGTGTFIQSGGTHTVTSTVDLYGTFHVGAFAGSSGQYTLSAGKFVAQNLDVGDAGTGAFTQTGGTSTVTSAFCVGLKAGSAGSYSLSGTGSLTANSTTSLGGSTTAAGGTGNLTISGGNATFTGAINVWPGSRLTLTGGTLSAPSLSLTSGSEFDLSGGTFTARIASEPVATFRNDLYASRIFSTAANADARLAIGYTTSATTLTARLTYLGDANLDGKITADDFALIDRGYAQHLSTWQDGDFNYDGVINSADYLLIDRVSLQQGAPLSPDFLSERESQFGPAYVSTLLASVPEPVALSSILCPLASLLLKRRRT